MVQKFFDLPEGKLLLGLFGGVDPKQAEAEFHLNKARFVRGLGIGGDALAEEYYKKLKDTPYAKFAEAESMGMGAKFHENLTSAANMFLSVDQILLIACSG